jgi:dCMP deaminase
LYATKNGATVEGTTLYVTLSPCIACARVIYTMKIKKVFYKDSYANYKGLAIDEGVEFLRKFGVDVQQYQ